MAATSDREIVTQLVAANQQLTKTNQILTEQLKTANDSNALLIAKLGTIKRRECLHRMAAGAQLALPLTMQPGSPALIRLATAGHMATKMLQAMAAAPAKPKLLIIRTKPPDLIPWADQPKVASDDLGKV
jgi:GTPase Era involved in 16S rRNA processing